jgi:glycerol-3-phosphate acyltransferase PlsY
MLGHVFSPFLRFKGGKGVSTALGLTIGLFPYMTLPALAGLISFVAAFKLTRYMSAGSLAGAAVFPLAYVTIALARGWEPFTRQWPLLAISTVVAGLIIFRHRENIVRLWRGTEMRSI